MMSIGQWTHSVWCRYSKGNTMKLNHTSHYLILKITLSSSPDDLSGNHQNKQWVKQGNLSDSSLTWMLWIAVLLLTVSCSGAETVNRFNYGVLFKSQGSVCAVYDFLTHTFQVPFPDLKQSRLDRKADRNMSYEAIAPKHVAACKVMEKALESVNDVRNQYVRNWNIL